MLHNVGIRFVAILAQARFKSHNFHVVFSLPLRPDGRSRSVIPCAPRHGPLAPLRRAADVPRRRAALHERLLPQADHQGRGARAGDGFSTEGNEFLQHRQAGGCGKETLALQLRALRLGRQRPSDRAVAVEGDLREHGHGAQADQGERGRQRRRGGPVPHGGRAVAVGDARREHGQGAQADPGERGRRRHRGGRSIPCTASGGRRRQRKT
jgi:hypothetical protein